MTAKLTFRGRKQTATHGYTIVEPTAAELAKAPASNPKRMSCNTCGKRIWCSGLGIGAHERSVFHRTADGALPSTPVTPVAEQPEPVAPPSAEKLIAAAARMADRMCATIHRAGLAVGRGDGWEKLHARSARQGRVMHRLLDAAQRAHGARPGGWHLDYTIMTFADHRRSYAREQAAKQSS